MRQCVYPFSYYAPIRMMHKNVQQFFLRRTNFWSAVIIFWLTANCYEILILRYRIAWDEACIAYTLDHPICVYCTCTTYNIFIGSLRSFSALFYSILWKNDFSRRAWVNQFLTFFHHLRRAYFLWCKLSYLFSNKLSFNREPRTKLIILVNLVQAEEWFVHKKSLVWTHK